ncbi:MAG: type II toxin-antitoxin system prevent-host-death family antitoxin [Desulfococcaceae bacterium]
MRTVIYTSARSSLAKTMMKVCEDHEPVIITRKSCEPVVMISLEDYGSVSETAYLLRSPKNAKRLMSAIEELESGGGTERDHRTALFVIPIYRQVFSGNARSHEGTY